MARPVYRVCRAIHSRLDGLGAKLVGGRWNSPGHAVVYMSQSVSLAVLENLVHMQRVDFPNGYVCISALIPDDISILNESQLRHLTANVPNKTAGDLWHRRQISAVLEVRSAVVPAEFNYLLNPGHPDFSRITVASCSPFHFDPRLFGATRETPHGSS